MDDGTGHQAEFRQIVAGVGFRNDIESDELVELIERALVLAGVTADRLGGIATPGDRAALPAVVAACRVYGLRPTGISADAMRAVDSRVQTRSIRIMNSRGVGSVAEAAALALTGETGRLLLPRIASARATCALARTEP